MNYQFPHYGISPGQRPTWQPASINKIKLDDLVVLDDVRFFNLDNDSAVVLNARNNKHIVIPSGIVRMVMMCDTFQTIPQHTDNIQNALGLPAGIADELRKTLAALHSHGLLLSAADVERTLSSRESQQRNVDAANWVIGIHSCDRPRALRRLLESAIPHLLVMEHKPELLFIDDSRGEENARQNKAVISDFVRQLDITHQYWDRTRMNEWAAKLVHMRPSIGKQITWLLSPAHHHQDAITTGIAKNWLQILRGNRPMIMIDDDAVLEPMLASVSDGTHLNLVGENHLAIPFHPQSRLDSIIEHHPLNPFSAHLEKLGSSLSENIASADNERRIQLWRGLHRTAAFRITSDDHIALTTNGVFGAQHSRHMDFLFYFEPSIPHIDEFLSKLRPTCEIPQTSWLAPINAYISRSSPFICTTMSGIAPSTLPAPTLPAGRNQDLFLGEMHTYLHTSAQSYRFPWALRHLPEPERTWSPHGPHVNAPVNATAVLRGLLTECGQDYPLTDPTERLNYFTSRLAALMGQPDSGLRAHVAEQTMKRYSSQLMKLHELVRKSPNHENYRKSALALIASRKQDVATIFMTVENILRELREEATPMADAFAEWPGIVKSATELSS